MYIKKIIWTIFWGYSTSGTLSIHSLSSCSWLVFATGLLYALWGWALWTPFLGPSCWLTSDWVWQWKAPSDVNEGKRRVIRTWISFLCTSLGSSYISLMTAPPGQAAFSPLLQLSWALAILFLPLLLKPRVVMASSCCSFMGASLYLSVFTVATNNCKFSVT